MRRLALITTFALAGCCATADVAKTTEVAAQLNTIFTEHSAKWQMVFMAGKPSAETIAVVTAAAEEDRRRFNSLMTVFVQYLNSAGVIDPVKFQQQLIDVAREVKDLTGRGK